MNQPLSVHKSVKGETVQTVCRRPLVNRIGVILHSINWNNVTCKSCLKQKGKAWAE